MAGALPQVISSPRRGEVDHDVDVAATLTQQGLEEMQLPAPMLARPAELPRGSGYAFEVKWDGFRALVSTVDG